MKKLLLVMLIIIHIPVIGSTEEVLITSGEYPPWSSKDYIRGGFCNHVIAEAFAREGYTVRVIYLHRWHEVYNRAKSLQADATSFWQKSRKRERFFFYSEPVFVSKVVFFYLKSTDFSWNHKLEDLIGYDIGISMGYSYAADIWKNNKLRLIESDDDITNFKKLLKGQIQLFPSGLVAGYTLLHRNFDPARVSLIEHHRNALIEDANYVLFPRGTKEKSLKLRRIFNKGLSEIKADGTYDTLTDNLLMGTYVPVKSLK